MFDPEDKDHLQKFNEVVSAYQRLTTQILLDRPSINEDDW
jgi:hypothetical protein